MAPTLRLTLANGLILFGSIPILLWLAAFIASVVPSHPLLPWVAAGIPMLFVPIFLVSAVIAGPAMAYVHRHANRQLNPPDSRWYFPARLLTSLALVVFGVSLACEAAVLLLGVMGSSTRSLVPPEDAAQIRQHDGLANPDLLNGKVNTGSNMVFDLTFDLTCANAPPADFGRAWVTFLGEAGFRSVDVVQDPRTAASRVRSLGLAAMDANQRQIEVWAPLAERGKISGYLLSAPPTRHDEVFEQKLLDFASGFPGCQLENVVRNDNGRSANEIFDVSAATQAKILDSGATQKAH